MPDSLFWTTAKFPKQSQAMAMMEHPASFNELLISEVRSHPQLYDQQHRVCTDSGERNVIWEVIAQRIDESVTGEFAKKRWLQMRDRYRKELKMALRTSIQPKWPYFSKLSWLDPYLKDAKSIKSESSSPLNHPNNLVEITRTNKQEFPSNVANFSTISNTADKIQEQSVPFPQIQTVSLLESLMAASRELLERQREKLSADQQSTLGTLEFSSPDSAVASTSGEESWENQQQSAKDDIAEPQDIEIEGQANGDEGLECTDDSRVRQDRISTITQLISQRLSQATANSAATTMPADPFPLQMEFATSLLNSAARSDNFGTFPMDNCSPRSQRNGGTGLNLRLRSRNPAPYLVRRGTSSKAHNQQQSRPQSESNSATSTPRKSDIASVCPAENTNNEALQPTFLYNSQPQTTELFPNAEEWARMDLENDEDFAFARLVVARLKKFDLKKRREIRSQIHQWLDQTEEEVEMVEQQAVEE